MNTLTDRQTEIFDTIKSFIAVNRYAPSVRELSDALNITVKGVFDHLEALEHKGYIARNRKIARSIRITEVTQ